MKCWASSLGNCSNKLSREHVVSESLFPSGVVEVHGFHWCKDKPVRLGIQSVTARILCTRHNNDLSSLDDEASHAFEMFRQANKLISVRGRLKPAPWRLVRYEIDGFRLERWCLKTLINLCFEKEHAIGRDSVTAGAPSERLVRLAYGLDSFNGKSGLFAVTRLGMPIRSDDVVQFAPLYKQNGNIEAGIFTFHGLMLLLYLEEEGPPKPFTGVYMNGEDLGHANVHHHHKRINFEIGRRVSHSIIFRW